MNYFTRVLKYGLDYTYYGVLNIVFNILYAIFSALAFVSFIPMLDVLFKQTRDVYIEPEYSGISNIREYLEDYFNYYISRQLETDISSTLILVVGIVLHGETIEDFGPINFSSIVSLLIIGELSAQDIFSKLSADNFTEVSTANTFDFESPKNNIISEY